MYDGTIKKVQNIKINDLLMGDDNTFRKVLNISSGKDVMYEIIQENGNNYKVNSEHIISLKLSITFIKKNYELIWFENHILYKKKFINDLELENYKLYLLNNKNINKQNDICDISIKEYIKKSKKWKNVYKGFKCEKINCWMFKQVDIDPYIFGYNLNKDNIININKYKYNDVNIRSLLLDGFLDANGKDYNNNNIVFKNPKSKKILDNIIFIIRSLGYLVYIDETKEITTIINYKSNNNSLLYNIKVKKLEYNDYYGFELDGNKRFLLGDFTVTHNTSTILSIAYQLFGPKVYKERVIELNASDERGINIVRFKINTFAKIAIGNIDPKYPCPPFKLVILDEADAMTTEAQSALRKVMEELSGITRFCFICNYINQIIDPIVSRCMKFRFKPIDKIIMYNKLNELSIKEKMVNNKNTINAITNVSKGDIRKGILILQNLQYIQKYKSNITENDVYNMTGNVNPEYVKSIWDLCLNKKTNINIIIETVNKIKLDAVSINSILENLQLIIVNSDLDDIIKSKLCIFIASTEKCLMDGANEHIQLLNIFSYIYGLVNNYIVDIPENIC